MLKKFEIVNKGGKKAIIKINGAIDWWGNSEALFTQMIDKAISDGCEDVEGYINSPGGSMFDANEIGNQILRFTGTKTCKLGALCASAGTTLSTYFDTVEAASNCQYMIHDPISRVVIEHLEDYESDRKLYENLRNNAIERYVDKTGLSKEVISDMMKKTTWMNAKEAKAKGFIDSISGEKADMPSDAKNVINEYKYANVPEILNQEFTNPPKISMKKIALKFGLPEDATEDQILAAINKAENEASLKAEGNSEKGIKILVAMAKSKGMDVSKIEKLAKADFDTTHALVVEFKSNEASEGGKGDGSGAASDTLRLSDVINAIKESGKSSSEVPNMTFSEMVNKNIVGLKEMFKKDPTKVQALFKAEFGSDCPNKDLEEMLK